MTRPDHLKAAGLTPAEVGGLLDAVAAVAERVRLAFPWRPLLRDIDDEMVLETAVNGRADGIATFNRRDFALATQQFGIAVLSPVEALSGLEKKQSESAISHCGCNLRFSPRRAKSLKRRASRSIS